jgi:hypothetical protein
MNGKAHIVSIEFLSREAEEALITISDGENECIAFSQPCHNLHGDIINQYLHAFNTKSVLFIDDHEDCYIRQEINSLEATIKAIVVDLDNGIVRVGSIEIELDKSFPGGIRINDCVEFNCGRLDLW